MNDETNHIDDLFKDLNRLEGNPGEQDWQAILRKMKEEKGHAMPPVLPVDELFGQGFDGFERPVSNSDWNVIQDKMAAGKKRRRVLILLWLLPLLMVVGSGAWMLLSQWNTKGHSAAGTVKPTTTAVSPDINAVPQDKSVTDNAEPAIDNAIAETPATNNEPGNITTAPTLSTVPPPDAYDEPGNLINATPATGEDQRSVSHHTAKGSNSANVTKDHTAASDKTQTTQTDVAANTDPAKTTGTTAEPSKQTKTADATTPADGVKTDKTDDAAATAVAPDPSKQIASNAAATDTAKPKQQDTKKTPTPPVTPGKWRLMLNAGVGNTFRSLDAENTPYKNIRNGQEHPIWLMSYGLNLDYGVSKHWKFGTGLGYTQTGYNAQYNYHRTIYDSFPHLNPQGQIIGWFRLNYRDTMQTGTEHLVRRYVAIPFSAQYRFALNAQSLTGTVGIATTMNIFAGAQGNVITPYGSLDIQNVKAMQDHFKGINMSMQVSTGIEYRLNTTWSLGVNAFFSHAAQNIYSAGYPVKEMPWSVGGNASLIFHLPSRNIANPVVKPKL